MSDDLKPCPFCTEGKSVSTYFDHEQGDKWGYAACDACGSRGPEVRTNYDRADDAPWRAEAIAAWNTRTPDPSIEALTEQLEAARADAKEAEAYAEELEKQLNICRMAQVVMENGIAEAEKERDDYAFKLADANNTYSEMHVALSEANDKLAKAVEALRFYAWENEMRLPSDGPWGAGSTDFGKVARTTLAVIKGGNDAKSDL